MALRTKVTSTTTAGGEVVVEGTVVDGGPGGARNYVCDVQLFVDGEKMDWIGPSAPAENRVSEDFAQIAVWWQGVSIPVIPEAPAKFTVTVAWKENAESPAVASIVASDASQFALSQASLLIEKEAVVAEPVAKPAK